MEPCVSRTKRRDHAARGRDPEHLYRQLLTVPSGTGSEPSSVRGRAQRRVSPFFLFANDRDQWRRTSTRIRWRPAKRSGSLWRAWSRWLTPAEREHALDLAVAPANGPANGFHSRHPRTAPAPQSSPTARRPFPSHVVGSHDRH